MSSNILSCIEGFLFIFLEGLSQSFEVPVPLSSDPELHSNDESGPVLKMQDLALMMPGIKGASSKSNSDSSIFGGMSKSSRATLTPILEAFLTGEGLYILEPRL